jgi:hypothetical protein
MAFAFARILAASSFVATNRNAMFRLWLAGISGLPDRFAIPSYFLEINYLNKYMACQALLWGFCSHSET